MDNQQKVFININCKIYNDSFSDQMADRLATGNEIYDFLMEDACHCFTEDGQIIPGDCNLWYLGCNEKFGYLVVKDDSWNWDAGDSSFDNVEAFVNKIYGMGLFNEQQYKTLTDKIAEGRQVENMYDIGKYLICKRDGKTWTKDPYAGKFRENIKRMMGDVEDSFRKNGYRFYR